VIGATVKAYGATQEMMEWRDTLQALSEPSGSFEIKGVPEGRRQIVATHPDYAPGDALVDVVAGKGPVEARLIMTQGGRIEGVARKRDGTPLAGLEVGVYSSSRARSGGMRPNPVTRGDGTFTAEHIAPGQTYVNLMAPVGPGRMMSMMSKQVEVREGETTSVEFLSREILVNGHVTKSGTPLSGLRLRFMGEGGMSMSMSAGFDSVAAAPTGPQRHTGTTGEDGTFALIVDTPGKYWVNTESVDGRVSYPSREVQIPDVETHNVELTFSGVPVTGVVIDKETDQPVAQAFVRAIPKNKEKADPGGGGSARTGADGRFQFDTNPGDYMLSAGSDGYASTNVPVTVPASGLSDARLELEKGLEIKGRVVDASGQGVPSLNVSARSSTDELEGKGAQTLADGTFRMAGLPARPFNLCAGTELAGYAVRTRVAPGGAGRHHDLASGGEDSPPRQRAGRRADRQGVAERDQAGWGSHQRFLDGAARAFRLGGDRRVVRARGRARDRGLEPGLQGQDHGFSSGRRDRQRRGHAERTGAEAELTPAISRPRQSRSTVAGSRREAR
jgi:hypothetical protein